MRLVVLSGVSGSGKSIALNALEDLGFYCIDNLPIALLPAFAQFMRGVAVPVNDQAAVGIDARNLSPDFQDFPAVLEEVRATGIKCEIVFLDADDATLFKRFSETRRKHPLSNQQISLAEAIARERQLLDPLVHHADWRIDTSQMNVHELATQMAERLTGTQGDLSLQLLSFGFKHGVPSNADFVFDARAIPNPYWELALRPYTGLQTPIIEYLAAQPLAAALLQDIIKLLDTWVPYFQREHRRYLTVAVGCTGGRHRSVYLVAQLAAHFQGQGFHVITRHRELI